jgi:ATP-dependent RNA helicase DeaD
MTRLFVGAGRAAGIRPKDLVGAIAGESGISGREIGHIEIADQFSLVEVPSQQVEAILGAMRNTTIKGKRATFRRERF